ncbi:hypothetical protein [Falsiroseomonas tokyonensis]|uniref:Uncharacterized protein n=1 Tax=Falsiroseomonas tokyonensis TaxID=430521 RepID=A0ABV7BT70_9PROT|nr:hypothetical protein [Falsiroseomonas tokyonensis]MBU8538723.1 hypothetical protein [Falsiroseomonas tokyonensis]
MMVPLHIRHLLALRASGCGVHMVKWGDALPPHRIGRRALLWLGDDLDEVSGGSRGPVAFDRPELRAWFSAMRSGAPLGIFAGAPHPEAYAAVCAATAASQPGGIIVECAEATYRPWADFATVHAPDALRLDVGPPSIARAAAQNATAAGRGLVFL